MMPPRWLMAASVTVPSAAQNWSVGILLEQHCEGTEKMRMPCKDLPPCPPCVAEDCAFHEWEEWSHGDCTGLCERQRNIKKNNNRCGEPCTGAEVETKNSSECLSCQRDPTTDCVWSQWSQWTNCSSACGGGEKSRSRHIKKFPKGGGQLCDAKDAGEMKPCNTQKCDKLCIDGKWTDWEDWGQCTHPCDGGVRHRSRNIKREANECGTPVDGKAQEYEGCNLRLACEKPRDCKWNLWNEWSSCSCTCDGVKRRHRNIKQYGHGNGTWCEGGDKEIKPCNPGLGKNAPKGCKLAPAVDCQIDTWTAWSTCSQTCGKGQQSRERNVTKYSQMGGKPCEGHLKETRPCSEMECKVPKKVDCVWGDWSDWGACHKCAGQMHRTRVVKQMPKHGGKSCGKKVSQEWASCPRSCGEKTFCEWKEWSDWDTCSSTCGIGSHERTRQLVNSNPKAKAPQKKFEELEAKTDFLKNRRPMEMVASYSAGAVTFISLFAAVRFVSSRNSQRYEQLQLGQQPLASQAAE